MPPRDDGSLSVNLGMFGQGSRANFGPGRCGSGWTATFVPNSMLCGEKNETRDQLYFACPYSFTIWMNIAERILGQVISPDWEETVTALMHPNRTRMDTILLRLNFHCTIYAIWMERNSRRHGGV
ncbi:hypothetical protein YC2023_100159 [Brassica napus]